ncbi:hypothetical protein EYD10_12474, partial [Varanus komodoensis]
LADPLSVCNCNQYLKISREKMLELVKRRGCLTGEDAATEGSAENAGAGPEAGTLALAPQPPVDTRNIQWLEQSSLDTESALLPSGMPLKFEAVPAGILSREDLAVFYCCSQCGKVFWEGSHFGRVISQFQEVLSLSEEESRSLYEQL